jgi:hypothetical protein
MGKSKQNFANNEKSGNVTRKVTLRYAQVRIPTGAANSWALRGNGMYDPDVTGAGAQPSGFDQYMAIYKNYRVIGSRCIATYIPGSSAFGSGVAMLTVRWDDNEGTVASTVADLLGQRNSVSAYTTGVGATVAIASAHCLTKTATRLSPNEIDLSGTVTSDPAIQWHWHVNVNSVDEASTASGRLHIVIEYDVEFFGMRGLLLS